MPLASFGHELRSAVAAPVVDQQDLEPDARAGERFGNALDHLLDTALFVEQRNYH
jgi:hypothetical protein